MNTVPETSRTEVKFIAGAAQFHMLLTWLRVHPAGFVSPFPDRRVNNIYFDTYDWTAFAENLSGVSSRTKVRYRWYGDSVYPDAGTLEVKKKRNCHGWKLQFKIGAPPYGPGAGWQEIIQSLLEQLPPEGRRWLKDNPVPVIMNRYMRKYLVSGNAKVRVTIDSGMCVWEQRFKPYPNFIHRANMPDLSVVEFKFSRGDYEAASQVIQGIPIRQGRHSKYVTGVRAVAGLY
ncbi:MAG: polyphosphate polymerase domain-containing protein [Nitrospiraceae bacterium]|nr:MAG: polyphosphate polymerase domain-containing protein [Nitrospiraceae bacterium]